MTLVEYGELTVRLIYGKPEMVITCTMPEELLAKLSIFEDLDMKLIIDKKSRVFVDIPEKLFEET